MLLLATRALEEGLHRGLVLPALHAAAGPDDLVAELDPDLPVAAAHREVAGALAGMPDVEAVVLVAGDAEVPPDLGDAVRVALAERPRAGLLAVAGSTTATGVDWWSGSPAGRLQVGEHVHDHGPAPQLAVADRTVLVVRPEVLAQVELPDDATDLDGLAAELSLRSRALGWEVALLDAWVTCHAPRDLSHPRDDEASAAFRRRWCREAGHLPPGTPAEPGPPCPVCGTPLPASTPLMAVRVVTCEVCRAGVTVPLVEHDEQTDAIWEDQYGGRREAMAAQWRHEARLRLAWVHEEVPSGHLLEVGCAMGELLAVAAEQGHTVTGIEPSPGGAAQAAALGVGEVVTDSAGAWRSRRPDVQVAAVLCFHVLEHVPTPLPFLQDVREAAGPGVPCYFEVPNWASRRAARDPVAWTGSALHEHVVHYSPEAARWLFDRAGLDVVEVTGLDERTYLPPGLEERWIAAQRERGWHEPPLDLLRIRAVTR